MGNEPKDEEPRGPDDEPDPDERPTVVPKFDPAALARETAGGSKSPSSLEGAAGGKAVDVHNERTVMRKSPATAPPESAPPETTQMSDSVRTSLLSMADSRVPSVKPGPHRVPSMSGFAVSPVDRGWEDLSLEDARSDSSRPKGSPSDGPFRKPTSRLRAPSGERTAETEEDESEKPTREHPVLTDTPASIGVPREEPSGPSRIDTPEHTVFAPARAAAALTAAAAKPKASERPAPLPETAPAGPLSPEGTLREMRDRFSLGDYTGALVLADGLLEDDPGNLEVKECAENCRQVLRQMYTARIGPLDRVPVVTVARDQLRWLSIDHRAGFVLSHIDGISSLEMILDVSGMPLLDALRILCELAQQRIISFR